MNSKNVTICETIDELQRFGSELIRTHNKARLFAFYGDLGAGKTTLMQAICHHLKVTDTVNSPTFALVNVYHAPVGEVYHFDFYRIENVGEFFDIGYEDYFFSGNYCFIEWPEKIEAYLPQETVKVRIRVDMATGQRFITVEG